MSALPSALPSSNKWDTARRKPSLKLVIGTLFVVALPIELGFLAVLEGVGWLEIPFLLIVFFVLFFCVTVRPFSRNASNRLVVLRSRLINSPNLNRSEHRCRLPSS